MATIEVQWKKMGDEFTYDVFYARNSVGPWIPHNRELLTDEILDKRVGASYTSENRYLVDELEDDTVYFFKVSCEDRYYQWWYSYSSISSIEGGYGSSLNRPIHGGGNNKGFNVNI